MKTIVLATSNEGKIKEIQAYFKNLDLKLVPQSFWYITHIAETGLTFLENALLKARHAAELIGLPVIAEDSGLVIDALQGAPGIYSARYAGLHTPYPEKCKQILTKLKGVPREKRKAYFHCSMIYLSVAQDPCPIIAEGRWEGYILEHMKGQGGFGYDPIFEVDNLGKSAAELSIHEKNQYSHRAQALHKFAERISFLYHKNVLCGF